MSENVFLLNEDDKGIQQSEFLLATIVTADGTAGTATILLDGMTAANVKPYKAMVSAWPLAQGDRVVVMKLSGTYLVLGKIGSQPSTEYEPAFDVLPILKGGSGMTGTERQSVTSYSDIITAGTGITVSSAHFSSWGKLAMLNVFTKATTADATKYAFTLGTLKSGFRPCSAMCGIDFYGHRWNMGGNGEISIADYRKANEYYNIYAVYLLP